MPAVASLAVASLVARADGRRDAVGASAEPADAIVVELKNDK